MKTWLEFLNKVNENEIDQLYSKAHVAVQIVNYYNPKILDNISVIGNLGSGAYGVYNSGENKKYIPPQLEKSLVYYGRVNRRNLDMIPKKTIQQYYPQVDLNQIKPGDTIRVNIQRIIREAGSDFEAIMEIASTIIHEATHEIERETTGTTSEVGPVKAEQAFKAWAMPKQAQLMRAFPELQGDVVGPKGVMPTGRV